MEKFAAGIVPYILINEKRYFLLGLEKSNNKWSGFVGSAEDNETVPQTALREFNEETACIFRDYLDDIGEKVLKTTAKYDTTATGRIVYIYFIELPEKGQDCIKNFIKDRDGLLEECYHEKSILKWFTIDEIEHSNRIFYKLKKMIKITFNCV